MDVGDLVAERFRIERRLGAGWHGTVYRARDTKFATQVALKVADGRDASDYAEFRRRFQREARLGNRLGKIPGFVRAFDWGELPQRRLYLAMDLVRAARPLDLRSGTLSERLERLCAGAELVREAHRRGVIHRDLKPSNFLVDEAGEVFLSDFGLAKLAGEEEDSAAGLEQLTQAGRALGTVKFMPPEQFEDASAVDPRSDVFALGVMLFLALAGRFPFAGEGGAAIYQSLLRVRRGEDPPPRPSEHRQVGPDLDALSAQAIAIDPDARVPDALEFVRRLRLTLHASAPRERPSAQLGRSGLVSMRPRTQLGRESEPLAAPDQPVPPVRDRGEGAPRAFVRERPIPRSSGPERFRPPEDFERGRRAVSPFHAAAPARPPLPAELAPGGAVEGTPGIWNAGRIRPERRPPLPPPPAGLPEPPSGQRPFAPSPYHAAAERDTRRLPRPPQDPTALPPWVWRVFVPFAACVFLWLLTLPLHDLIVFQFRAAFFSHDEVHRFGTLRLKKPKPAPAPYRNGKVLIVRRPVYARDRGNLTFGSDIIHEARLDPAWSELARHYRAGNAEEVRTVVQIYVGPRRQTAVTILDLQHQIQVAHFTVEGYPEFEYGGEASSIVEYVQRLPLGP